MLHTFIIFSALLCATTAIAAELPVAGDCPPPEFPHKQEDSFKSGIEAWTPRETSQWKWVDSGEDAPYAKLTAIGKPGEPRAPFSWIVREDWQTTGSFVLSAEGRCLRPLNVPGRDLLLIIGWKAPLDYQYIHFSAENSDFHNVIMQVKPDGRKRIPHATQPQPRLTSLDWQTISVWYDVPSRILRCYVDGATTPIMSCKLEQAPNGAIGIGSFDDLAEFRRVTLHSQEKNP